MDSTQDASDIQVQGRRRGQLRRLGDSIRRLCVCQTQTNDDDNTIELDQNITTRPDSTEPLISDTPKTHTDTLEPHTESHTETYTDTLEPHTESHTETHTDTLEPHTESHTEIHTETLEPHTDVIKSHTKDSHTDTTSYNQSVNLEPHSHTIEAKQPDVNISEIPPDATKIPIETSEILVKTTETLIETTEIPTEIMEIPIQTTEIPSIATITETPTENREILTETTEIPTETTNEEIFDEETFEKAIKIMSPTHDMKNKHGTNVILLIIMRDQIEKDGTTSISHVYKKLKKTFEKIQYVFVPIVNPSYPLLKAILKVASDPQTYLLRHTKLMVYCLAPIGCEDNGEKYIICDDNKHCYIKKNIIDTLANGLPQWNKYFLFDGYLSNDSCTINTGGIITTLDIETISSGNNTPSYIPKQGNILVGYSPLTFIKQIDLQPSYTIGTWTIQLCDNIDEYILPVTSLLDKTWNDTTLSTTTTTTCTLLEPHYVSLMGVSYLVNKYDEIDIKSRYTNMISSPLSQQPVTIPVATTNQVQINPTLPQPSQPVVVEEEINIDNIMDTMPTLPHLKDAILNDLQDTGIDIWRDRFGKRLISNKTKRDMCSIPEYLLDLLYDVKPQVTWGEILTALNEPTTIKRKSDKGEIGATLRKYMYDNYWTYAPNSN